MKNLVIKEQCYLGLMVLTSALMYLSMYYYLADFSIEVLLSTLSIIVPLYFLGIERTLGNLRNNAIQVSEKQFPEIFEILNNQSKKLGLLATPTVYVTHNGGFLNALAMKLYKQDYIVLYSEVLEAAFQEGMPVVEFIMGHELGHIKRKHTGSELSRFIFPAKFVPIIGDAYSRACEYTCDSIGYDLSPEGAQKGLLILCAGKNLYKKIDVTELIINRDKNRGCATLLAELFSTHPALIKRIEMLTRKNDSKNVEQSELSQNKAVSL